MKDTHKLELGRYTLPQNRHMSSSSIFFIFYHYVSIIHYVAVNSCDESFKTLQQRITYRPQRSLPNECTIELTTSSPSKNPSSSSLMAWAIFLLFPQGTSTYYLLNKVSPNFLDI